MTRLDVPVLVVGAGPAGLMASLLLEQLGVECLVAERRPSYQRAPAAHVVNARTFEICRAAGVDMQAIGSAAMDPADAGWVYFTTKLGHPPFGRLPFERQGDDQLAVTPTPIRNLSQNRFEPLLLEALDRKGRQPRWQWQWESAVQDANGVRSQIRDLDADRVVEVHSRYLLAADGAGSRVRKSVDIAMQGPDRLQSFVMIHLDASLRDRLGDPPGVLIFLQGPGAGVFVVHDLDRESVYMHPVDPDQESLADYDEARCAELVRAQLADPDLDFEVKTISTWTMTAQVAEQYRSDRIFLVGDSAHRFPPTGGLGLNSGVQDAHNLAWKLAAVLHGRAPEEILETYESERRPIAQRNAEQSLRNAMRLIEVPQALGFAEVAPEQADTRIRETLADPDGRRRVEIAVENQAEHFDMPGLQLGFAYGAGPLVLAETDADTSDEPRSLHPSGAPGHRVPHTWLERDGETLSLLDLVPLDRWLLVVGPDADEWRQAASDDSRVEAVQMSAKEVPELSTWLAQAGIDGRGALLVRPDQHVAWRAPSAVADPAAALSEVLGRLGF